MYEDVKYSNTLLSVFNNGIIVQFGVCKTRSTITLPVAYTKCFSIAISHAYGDNNAMRTTKSGLTGISFSTAVGNYDMWWITIGF